MVDEIVKKQSIKKITPNKAIPIIRIRIKFNKKKELKSNDYGWNRKIKSN